MIRNKIEWDRIVGQVLAIIGLLWIVFLMGWSMVYPEYDRFNEGYIQLKEILEKRGQLYE